MNKLLILPAVMTVLAYGDIYETNAGSYGKKERPKKPVTKNVGPSPHQKTPPAKTKKIVQNENSSSKSMNTMQSSMASDTWDGHRAARFRNGFSVKTEFLLWKVAQEASEFIATPNTPYPVVDQQPLPNGKTSETLGKYQSANFELSPGLRIGASYTFNRDLWELMTTYTYYYTDGSKRINKPNDPTMFLFTPFASVSDIGVQAATSRTNFWYNVGDLMLSRRFLVSEQLLLNFSAGATGAWIQEHWHVNYYAEINDKITNNWSFSGGGLRAQIDSHWHLGCGLALSPKVSAAALLGHYSNENEILLFNQPSGDTHFNPLRKTSYSNLIVVPTLQFGLGLDWSRAFRTLSFTIGAAVEATTWLNLQQVYKDALGTTLPPANKIDCRDTSNVTLYGLTFYTGFDF